MNLAVQERTTTSSRRNNHGQSECEMFSTNRFIRLFGRSHCGWDRRNFVCPKVRGGNPARVERVCQEDGGRVDREGQGSAGRTRRCDRTGETLCDGKAGRCRGGGESGQRSHERKNGEML